MNSQIKVLHVVSNLSNGGVEGMLYNYYREIDKNSLKFDFITHGNNVGYIEKKLINLGSKVYHIPSKKENIIKYNRELKKVLKQNKYEIIHVHQNLMSFIPLYYAKKYNINNRIIHSHTCVYDESIGMKVYRKILSKLCIKNSNLYAACSDSAAKWLYGEQFTKNNKINIINNGIDVTKFLYSEKNRNNILKKYDIQNKYIIGHIGRFTDEKNHAYMVEICKILKEKYSDFVMIFIGDGENKPKIENLIKKYKLDNNIKLLGHCENVHEILNCMDLLLLPSKYEGFPVTLVEAQANGLKSIISDKVPKDTIISNNIKIISIEEHEGVWANEILNMINNGKYERKFNNNIENYEIKKLAKSLTSYYKDLIK